MKRRTLKTITFLMMAMALSFGASFADAASKGQISNMQMMTGDANGTWAVIGAAIAEKVNQQYPGFPFTAVPSPGSVANPLIVGSGDADFGISYPLFLVSAVKGQSPYDKPLPNLRAIAAMPATVLHILADSNKVPVTSLQEALDKKIPFKLGVPPNGTGSYMIFENIFSAYGLKKVEDIKIWDSSIYYATWAGLSDAWKDRMIDVTVGTFNLPASGVGEALSARKGTVLSIGEELLPKVVARGFDSIVIPKGTYPDQDADIITLALPMILFTRVSADEDLVYTITKTIYENDGYMKQVHSSFKQFDPNKMHEGNAIDLHPGAVRFYKEKGLM